MDDQNDLGRLGIDIGDHLMDNSADDTLLQPRISRGGGPESLEVRSECASDAGSATGAILAASWAAILSSTSATRASFSAAPVAHQPPGRRVIAKARRCNAPRSRECRLLLTIFGSSQPSPSDIASLRHQRHQSLRGAANLHANERITCRDGFTKAPRSVLDHPVDGGVVWAPPNVSPSVRFTGSRDMSWNQSRACRALPSSRTLSKTRPMASCTRRSGSFAHRRADASSPRRAFS